MKAFFEHLLAINTKKKTLCKTIIPWTTFLLITNTLKSKTDPKT